MYLLENKANPNHIWKEENCIQTYFRGSKPDFEVVKKFHERGANFKRRDNEGKNVLHSYFYQDHPTLEETKFLVEKCGLDYKQMYYGKDCLEIFGLHQKESFDIFNYFFKGKFSSEVVHKYFGENEDLLLKKYLESYSEHTDLRFIKLFVELKANTQFEDPSSNLIFLATRSRVNVEVLKYLVDLKVNPDIRNLNENPLYNLCYYRSNVESIQFILENSSYTLKEKSSSFSTFINHTYDYGKLDASLFFLFLLHGADPHFPIESWRGLTSVFETSKKNEACFQVVQNFQKLKIWEPKFYFLFPKSIQISIFFLILCIKYKFDKFPKPLFHIILNFHAINFHKSHLQINTK
jgi:hypothetical protein